MDIKEVQEMVENHLKEMVLKHFDPKKADSIFTDEVSVAVPDVTLYCSCPFINPRFRAFKSNYLFTRQN